MEMSSSSSSGLDFFEAFKRAAAAEASRGCPVSSMGVQPQGPPQVTQDKVGGGPVKKLKSPTKESSSVKKGDAHNDKKSVSSSSSFNRIFFDQAADQFMNDKEDKEKKVTERIQKNSAFMKNRRQHVVEKSNEQIDKEKETLKKLSFLPRMSVEKKKKELKTSAKVNDKPDERCDMAKVNLSLGRSGSDDLVKGMEGGRSVGGGALKRVSTDFVGMSGDAKKAKLEQERCAGAASITPKVKEKNLKSILDAAWMSNEPNKTVRWREGEEGIEDVRVFELGEKELVDVPKEKSKNGLYELAVKLFGRKPQPKGGKPK